MVPKIQYCLRQHEILLRIQKIQEATLKTYSEQNVLKDPETDWELLSASAH